MSVSVVSEPDADESDGQPTESDVFEQIYTDPGVCSNCFRRISVGLELVRPQGGRDSGLDTERVSWRTPDGCQGEALDDPPDSVPSVLPLARGATTCASCGSVDGLALWEGDRQLSQREALRRVDPLIERLRDRDLAVSESHLRTCVWRGKSRSAWQGYDKAIFAAAVTVGLRHG